MERISRKLSGRAADVLSGAACYPERVVVRGFGESLYWIDQGARRPIRGSLSLPAVRLSQIDLRRWPIGSPATADEVETKWRGLDDRSGRRAGVAVLPDGSAYHMEGARARKIVSTRAMEAWQLHLKPARTVTAKELASRAEWLPVIPPPLLRQRL